MKQGWNPDDTRKERSRMRRASSALRLLDQAVAINKIGNMLASEAARSASDDDPELVEAAIPFGLKTYESLLAESPKHTGLLLAAAQGFTEYSYVFVDSAHRRSPRREPGNEPMPAQPRAPAL